MRTILRNNGLSLALMALFLLSLAGHAVAGYRSHNEDQAMHSEESIAFSAYLQTGAFIESVAENWESEFLQMGAFVLLTVFLFQKGSPESKEIGGSAPDTVLRNGNEAPWPVRRGGLVARLYGHSLSIVLILLFLASFAVHVLSGARAASAEAISHGEPAIPALTYLHSARLWFESFQNWQSEFLSMAMLVVLSIFLREKASPESKPLELIPPPGSRFHPDSDSIGGNR